MRAPPSASRAARRSRGRASAPATSPAARNVPYNQLFDAATGAMKPLDDLRKAFAGAGVKLDAADRDELRLRRFGRRADARALPAGRRDTALYDGSWSEWGQPDGPPVATGPA